MRQIQSDKQAAYSARLGELAKPTTDLLISRLEQAAQVAIEDPRPQILVSVSVSTEELNSPDRSAIVNRIKSDISQRFSGNRGFNVMFSDSGDPAALAVSLTW